MVDRDKFRAELEQLGPARVRARVSTRPWNEERQAIAVEWLESLSDASQAEQIAIARSAKDAAVEAAAAARVAADAALEQAKMAREANTIAKIALLIAIAAAVAAILTLFR